MPQRITRLGFLSLALLSGCSGDAGPGIASSPPPPASPSPDPSAAGPGPKLVPSNSGVGLSPNAQAAPK